MLRNTLTSAAGVLLELLFPPACAGCGRPGAWFCDRCAQLPAPIEPPICPRCGQPQEHDRLCRLCVRIHPNPLALARAAALHDGPLRHAIHALKYENTPQLAEPLSRYLMAAWQNADWDPWRSRIDVVVPVPLHAQRRLQRGYNQAELLAAAFAATARLRVDPTLLERHRDTRPQVGLNAGERAVNVHDSFVAQAPLTGQVLLLVDDVYTTGATLRACASAALDAGAAAVCGLTVARPRLLPHVAEAIP